MRRRLQVGATRDQRNALQRVVVGDAQMVAGGSVLAGEDHVAELFGVADDGAFASSPRRSTAAATADAVPAPCPAATRSARRRRSGRHARPATARGRCRGRAARHRACAERRRIAGCRRGCRSTDTAGRAPPAHPARRDTPAVLRLHADLAIPIETEPGQVLQDRRGEFGAATRGIDVLEAQQEPAAGFARAAPGEQRAERVAEMQVAGGAGREAGDDRHGMRHKVVAPAAKGERHGGTRWTALGTGLEGSAEAACRAVPRAGRRRARPDRPGADLGARAAGRAVRLGRCAVPARVRASAGSGGAWRIARRR